MNIFGKIERNQIFILQTDEEDDGAKKIAQVMFDTAVLRSGYQLSDSVDFSQRILDMLYTNMDIDLSAPVSLRFSIPYIQVDWLTSFTNFLIS